MTGTSAQRILAIAKHDLRILRRDPVFLLIFTIMPLGFMAFTKGAFGAAMSIQYSNNSVNGAAQVVPGAAVLFSGFLVGNLGFAVFREHAWATWERLRASHLETWELMIGKSIAPILSLALQLTVMFGLGGLLFDLHIRGSVPAFLAVAAMLAIMEVALGFMLLAICRSILQLNAATNLGAMLLGGIGGAVTPFYFLPLWAQHIAPATPTYWAMRGFRSVIIDGGGFSAAALPIAALAAFSAGFTVIAAMRFGVEESKLSWA
jgi:ABC-2 type transport system permease protein